MIFRGKKGKKWGQLTVRYTLFYHFLKLCEFILSEF